MRFQHALVWYPATSAQAAPPSPVVSSTTTWQKLGFAYNVPARSGTKACKAFNEGTCTNAAVHPSELHVCSHCLAMAMVGRTFSQQEVNCNRKQFPSFKCHS